MVELLDVPLDDAVRRDALARWRVGGHRERSADEVQWLFKQMDKWGLVNEQARDEEVQALTDDAWLVLWRADQAGPIREKILVEHAVDLSSSERERALNSLTPEARQGFISALVASWPVTGDMEADHVGPVLTLARKHLGEEEGQILETRALARLSPDAHLALWERGSVLALPVAAIRQCLRSDPEAALAKLEGWIRREKTTRDAWTAVVDAEAARLPPVETPEQFTYLFRLLSFIVPEPTTWSSVQPWYQVAGCPNAGLVGFLGALLTNTNYPTEPAWPFLPLLPTALQARFVRTWFRGSTHTGSDGLRAQVREAISTRPMGLRLSLAIEIVLQALKRLLAGKPWMREADIVHLLFRWLKDEPSMPAFEAVE